VRLYLKNKLKAKGLVDLKTWGERRNGDIMKGMNLFMVHCIHAWNYHTEIPLYYYCMLIQKQNKRKRNKGLGA
jgi:hypothetical protein